MKILRTTDRNFRYDFGKVFKRQLDLPENIHKTVFDILDDVKRIGDQALIKYTAKYDTHDITIKTVEVTPKEIQAALKILPKEDLKALEMAAGRVEEFYKNQSPQDVNYKKNDTELALRTRPLERVGIYVPGGKASYPSSVIMTAIPAKVAGVKEIIMCSPWPNGENNPALLAAAHICGISKIFKLGGAQAIGAMAYGTKTLPKVDKIVGPGNIWVTLAKKMVYGEVDIDMIAGPTEIVVIADGSVPPAWIASDLLSQAEHDEMACSLLLTTNANYAIRVEGEVRKQILRLKRRSIASESIKKRGLIVLVRNVKEAIDLVNEIAPEHLELCLENADKVVDKIENAGAVFIGPWTPEAIGDYVAGPSHVLPTHGSARFFSVLKVTDFLKTVSIIKFGEKAFRKWGPVAAQLAQMEGLGGHASSIEMRLKGNMPVAAAVEEVEEEEE